MALVIALLSYNITRLPIASSSELLEKQTDGVSDSLACLLYLLPIYHRNKSKNPHSGIDFPTGGLNHDGSSKRAAPWTAAPPVLADSNLTCLMSFPWALRLVVISDLLLGCFSGNG